MTLCIEEYVDVVADDGIGAMVIETVPRSQANGKLTWTSQVIIENSDGYVLVTLRAKQEGRRYSGFWEMGITETVRSDEPKKEAARRGLEEELGITVEPDLLLPLFPNFYRNPSDPKDRKNAMVFLLVYNGKIRPNPEEIEECWRLHPSRVESEIRKIGMEYTPMNMRTWELFKGYEKQGSGLYVRL